MSAEAARGRARGAHYDCGVHRSGTGGDFFTSGGTEADNWAVKGSEGGLLVSAYEHHAVLKAAAHEAGGGRMVVYARPTRNGVIGVRQIADAWQKGIGLVSVMTANNEIGTVNDGIGEFQAAINAHGNSLLNQRGI